MSPINTPITVTLRPKAKDDLRNLEDNEKAGALKALRLIRGMTLPQLQGHKGLNFEKLQHLEDAATGKALWSFRCTGGARAICVMEPGPTLDVVAFEPDHDKAYRN